MCVTATVLAAATLVAASAGTAVSISAAQANKRAQQTMLDEQQKQLREEREIARLQAQEAEVERLNEFRRQRSSNAAALAASGLRENISFLQGVMPAEERALRLDIGSIRMGDITGQNRIASQIRVNRFSRDVAGFNAQAQTIGAVASLVGTAAQVGASYNQTRTPSGGGTIDFAGTPFNVPSTKMPTFKPPKIGR
jgi:hypothetical protein